MSQEVERPLDISLVAIPDAMASTLSGLYDALTCFGLVRSFDDAVPEADPFRVEIVAPTDAPFRTASGLPVAGHRAIGNVDRTDIVLLPSMMVERSHWQRGRYPDLIDWLSAMYARGALLCSACSGVLLLAETGLLDGRQATIHWAYAPTFRRNFPNVRLEIDKALVVTGDRQRLVMSGASASWHDLVLYLVARLVGPTSAQAITRFMLLQWHAGGQAPYAVFEPPTDHGDIAILEAQQWLRTRLAVASPVEKMVDLSGLPARTFKRRFRRATGHSPLAYVQLLRIEEAKRRLERTGSAIDEIGAAVGYEDPAFFRRLFKRVTKITPGAYRRRFRIPPLSRFEALGAREGGPRVK